MREIKFGKTVEAIKRKSKCSSLKIFIQEDDKLMKRKITNELSDNSYVITFFSKSDSTFDLLIFNPDILIQDYQTLKMIKCYEWSNTY